MLEKGFENYNSKNEEIKGFYQLEEDIIDILSNEIDSVSELNEVLDKLENSSQLKDKKFLKFSYLSPRLTFETINNGKKEIFIYNLETEDFEEKINEKLSETPKKLEKGNSLLSAMEHIFSENEKEFIGTLDDKDILKVDIYDRFGLNLKGKSLREIQIIFRENLKSLEILYETFTEDQKIDFMKQQKKYFEFFMGVGDKYEGGANYLIETEKNFQKIAENIVNNQNLTQVFLYMTELHQKIDLNNYQSTNVEKSYKLLIDTLNILVFERLKKEDASEEDFVLFSKILTGRGDYKNGSFEDKDIDDNLRNSGLASEVLLYVFQRKGGMLEKIGFKNIDDNLKGKKVSDKITEFKKEFSKITPDLEVGNYILKELNLGSLLSFENSNYEDLDFENQTKLTILDRLIKKLRIKLSLGKKFDGTDKNNNFSNILLEVVSESQDYIVDKIESSFSSGNIFKKSFWVGKKAEDFGLHGTHKEAYDLFIDMNGIGLLNFSDNSNESLKIIGKIGAVMVASVGAAILTGGSSLALQGTIAGGVGSIASWGVVPKGYDSTSELVTDLSTDLIVGTTTGAIGGKLTQAGINKFGKLQSDGTRALSMRASATINGLDIAILGFGAEIVRVNQMEKIFANQNMIIKSEDDDLENYYKK